MYVCECNLRLAGILPRVKPWLKIGLVVLLAALGALWLPSAPESNGSLLGSAAPPVSLRDLAGNPVSLASFRGRAVALNFWATWCAPCLEELPGFAAAWRASRGRCVELIAVTEDSSRDDASSQAARLELAFPILMDPDGAVARTYGVTGFPQTYLIDAEGKVRKVLTGRVSQERLEAALAPLVPKNCPGAG